VSTPGDRSTLVEPATVKVRSRETPLKNVAGSVFGGGMAGNMVLKAQSAPPPFVPREVKPWAPRGDHFYAALAVEQPRKYGPRGAHSLYGGPVHCHPCERYEAVTVDHKREMERKGLDGSRGERGFSGREYVDVMEDHRGNGPGEGIPRGNTLHPYLNPCTLNPCTQASTTSLNPLNPTPNPEPQKREFIDYKTSMITDEDPLRGLLFYSDLGLSHPLHGLKERTLQGSLASQSSHRP